MFDGSVAPAPRRGGPRSWLRLVIHDAILGDAAAGIVRARLAVPLVGVLTGLYIAASVLSPGTEIAVSFAIVPLALAAVLLPAALSIAVAASTFGIALVTEEVLAAGNGLTPLEAVELVAFGVVALGLRIAVARLVLGREALDQPGG